MAELATRAILSRLGGWGTMRSLVEGGATDAMRAMGAHHLIRQPAEVLDRHAGIAGKAPDRRPDPGGYDKDDPEHMQGLDFDVEMGRCGRRAIS